MIWDWTARQQRGGIRTGCGDCRCRHQPARRVGETPQFDQRIALKTSQNSVGGRLPLALVRQCRRLDSRTTSVRIAELLGNPSRFVQSPCDVEARQRIIPPLRGLHGSPGDLANSAKAVSHGRYVMFQIAKVAITRDIFAERLQRIADLRSPPMATATRAPWRLCAPGKRWARCVLTIIARLFGAPPRRSAASALLPSIVPTDSSEAARPRRSGRWRAACKEVVERAIP